MASYHNSFSYGGKNSLEEGLIVVAFEPDNGFMDSFLSMENVSDNYYDGTRRYDYGSKYSTSAEIKITLIKKDGSDFKLNEFRSYAKWLTGARINSWLDMYIGNDITYAFLGKFINLEQYKLDARTVAIRLTFSSVSPWAFSMPQTFDYTIGQTLVVTGDGILGTSDAAMPPLGVTNNGVVYANSLDSNSCFGVTDDGVIYLDTSYMINIDNQSDDLYTYIYLDVDYINVSGTELYIKNVTLDEETAITGISQNETISLRAKQFIVSDIPNKIFGDNFNFVWPRLAPGMNELMVYGSGKGRAKFTYRYPIKVGDCVIDTDILGNLGCDCDDGNSNAECSVDKQELYSMLRGVLG